MTGSFDAPPGGPAGIVMRIIPLIFALIGASIIFFVWTDDEFFGNAPTFFKVFASLVASVFVIIGLGGAFGARAGAATTHRLGSRGGHRPARGEGSSDAGVRTACTNCGARLDGKAEISPSGDVKCPSCGGWFNVRA